MEAKDIISLIEDNKQNLIREEFNSVELKEKISLLKEEEFFKLDKYLVKKLEQKDFSIFQFSKINYFPKVKSYIEKQIKIEIDDSWLYAYNYILHVVYSRNNIHFFEFLYKLVDKNKFNIIEFNIYEIALIKNEGFVFLECVKRLNPSLGSQIDSAFKYVYNS